MFDFDHDDMNTLINMLDHIGLKPIVVDNATVKLDDELFRRRLAEAAAVLPVTHQPQRVIGTQITTPLAAPAVVPATVRAGYCPKCDGTGRFTSWRGRDVGSCYTCNGTGRALPSGTPSYIKPIASGPSPATKPYPNIIAAFDAVQRRGLKKAQITIGDINISVAGRASRNPDALYVKHLDEYAGKLERDKPLQISYRCPSPQTMLRLLDAIEVDPRAAITAQAKTDADRVAEAVAAGLEPHVACCCCSAELTDPESRRRGIGPICAGRWGLFGFSTPEALGIDDL